MEMFERLGDQAGMASGYHQLGILAQDRGDHDTAEPLYQRSLAIAERLGDQAGMAGGHYQLGMLAQLRGTTTPPSPFTSGPWPSPSGWVTRQASPPTTPLSPA